MTGTVLARLHLSHLASVKEVLHHQQVQLLLRVVLGVLVANPVDTQDLGEGCRALQNNKSCSESRNIYLGEY